MTATDNHMRKEIESILIVEDEVELLEIYADVVSSLGPLVKVASNGKQALAHLDQNPEVTLVLCDISMPEMNGLEFLSQAIARHGYIPFVMLTAHAEQEKTAECLRLGAIDYLTKPFEIKLLKQNLLFWVEIAKRQRQLRSDPRYLSVAKMESLIRLKNSELKKTG